MSTDKLTAPQQPAVGPPCVGPAGPLSSARFSSGSCLTVPLQGTTWRPRTRLALIGAGLSVAALLVASAVLTPDPRGHGTHEQLGLPPCAFATIFGYPCPSCGMTTAWSHAARGQVLASLAANAGGTLLFAVACLMTPWLLASGTAGRWLWLAPREPFLLGSAAAFVTLTLTAWALRLLGKS